MRPKQCLIVRVSMIVEIMLMHRWVRQYNLNTHAYPNYQLWVLTLRLAHPFRIRV